MAQPYQFVLSRESEEAPNITVQAEGTSVSIELNAFKLFNTLANKDLIMIAMNDKLNELIAKHLDEQARKESTARDGR